MSMPARHQLVGGAGFAGGDGPGGGVTAGFLAVAVLLEAPHPARNILAAAQRGGQA